jgi:AcrR family transcriptional regulator
LLLEAGDQASVSIRAIADEVGCTPPAIYMHFADKEELFFQLCEDNFLVFAERMRAASESTTDPVESLRRSGEAYIRFALENPEHYRVLFMTQNPIPKDRPLEELAGIRCFMSLVESVQRCIDSGAFAPGDAFSKAVVLWTAVHGLASLVITADDFPWPDTDALIDQMLETLIRGLSAQPA